MRALMLGLGAGVLLATTPATNVTGQGRTATLDTTVQAFSSATAERGATSMSRKVTAGILHLSSSSSARSRTRSRSDLHGPLRDPDCMGPGEDGRQVDDG